MNVSKFVPFCEYCYSIFHEWLLRVSVLLFNDEFSTVNKNILEYEILGIFFIMYFVK